VCARCHASALAEVGDALGPYPSACADARSHYLIRTGHAPEITPDARGRSELGPYRYVSDNRFEVVADEVTEEDDAFAALLGWTRRAGGAPPSPGPRVRPGELVQLRRPGSKRARPLLVPPTLSCSSPVAAASHSGSDSNLISGLAVDS